MRVNGVQELIHRRRRQVLHHSILYCGFNAHHVADSVFDSWAQELAQLKDEHSAESAAAEYQLKAFRGFTGEAGYHLPLYELRASRVARRMYADGKADN